MSVRSEVAIAIKKGTEIPQEVAEELLDWQHASTDEVDYYLVTNVKWYHDFADVQLISKFIADISEDNNGALLEINEEGYEDNIGDPYQFSMYISRTLDLPVIFK